MDDRYYIQLARTEMREGYAAADVERILAVYADDYADMSCGQPCFSGAEAKSVKRAQLEQTFARFSVYSAPASIAILVLGEWAIDYGWEELQLLVPSGDGPHRHRTRYMSLWKRECSGCWKIALWIDNADVSPLLATEMIVHIQDDSSPLTSRLSSFVAECCREPLK